MEYNLKIKPKCWIGQYIMWDLGSPIHQSRVHGPSRGTNSKKSLIVYISWLSWCYAYMGHSLWAYYRTIFVCTSSTLLILEIKSHFSDRPDLVSVDFPVAWSPRFLTSRFSYFFSSDRGAVQKQVKMSNDVKLPIYIHRHLSAQMTG